MEKMEEKDKKDIVKHKKHNKVSESVKIMETTIKKLEDNLKESSEVDKELLGNIRVDKMKVQGLSSQLEEAKKENKQLLNILQQRCGESDLSKRSSQIDLSSCSTMSMVNLQYKYEELLASHNGLLKILDMRISEAQKAQNENENLKKEIEVLNSKLSAYEKRMQVCHEKVKNMRGRKNNKIRELKSEIDTLKIVHNQLVELLHKQCMERDLTLSEHIRHCRRSDKALLLQEVRKNNILTYENFKLSQELQYLRSTKMAPDSSSSSSNIISTSSVN